MTLTTKLDKPDDKLNSVITRIENNKVKVLEISKRLDNVEEKMITLRSSTEAANLNIITSKCVTETEDRRRRKNKLVLFGFSKHKLCVDSNKDSENLKSEISSLFNKFTSPVYFKVLVYSYWILLYEIN